MSGHTPSLGLSSHRFKPLLMDATKLVQEQLDWCFHQVLVHFVDSLSETVRV